MDGGKGSPGLCGITKEPSVVLGVSLVTNHKALIQNVVRYSIFFLCFSFVLLFGCCFWCSTYLMHQIGFVRKESTVVRHDIGYNDRSRIMNDNHSLFNGQEE